METEKRCSFYRSSGSPGMAHTHGYCEFDCTYIMCDGETKRCRKLDSLKQYLMGRQWMKMRIKVEKSAG